MRGAPLQILYEDNHLLAVVKPPNMPTQADASVYRKRRDAMASVLTEAGYEFQMPRGAFYFFPKAPGGDDVAFVDRLMKELILAVPGTGFGGPGHFRLAFCVDESVIYRAAKGFKKAMR